MGGYHSAQAKNRELITGRGKKLKVRELDNPKTIKASN